MQQEATQEATKEKVSDVITKKFSPTTNQPTNPLPVNLDQSEESLAIAVSERWQN